MGRYPVVNAHRQTTVRAQNKNGYRYTTVDGKTGYKLNNFFSRVEQSIVDTLVQEQKQKQTSPRSVSASLCSSTILEDKVYNANELESIRQKSRFDFRQYLAERVVSSDGKDFLESDACTQFKTRRTALVSALDAGAGDFNFNRNRILRELQENKTNFELAFDRTLSRADHIALQWDDLDTKHRQCLEFQKESNSICAAIVPVHKLNVPLDDIQKQREEICAEITTSEAQIQTAFTSTLLSAIENEKNYIALLM